MSTEEILEKILEALAAPQLPVSVDLRDRNNVASYLKRSPNRVRSDILCLPPFPRPIRLPVPGRAQALYKAREVIAWAEKHTSEFAGNIVGRGVVIKSAAHGYPCARPCAPGRARRVCRPAW